MARLRQFFDAYAEALSQGNIESIAAAYAEQFMATGPGMRRSMDNDETFRAGLAQAAQLYKQIGVDVVEVKTYLEAELSSGYWLVKIEWELLDEDLNTLVTFDNTYLVEAGADSESGAKVVLFIAHNETARLQAMGLIPERD
jgi:glutathionyl-hydroquinone reductase